MRRYQVYLKGEGDVQTVLTIEADDVNLVSADGPSVGVFLNFWQLTEEASAGTHGDVTVAAVPLGEVRYVLSI
jgi:hypothetical protein